MAAAVVSRLRWPLLLLVLLLAALGVFGGRIVQEVRAIRHFRSGKSALAEDDFAAALRHFAQCLKAWPQSAETHFLAARAARRAGALGAARRELAEAARLDWVPEALALERALLRAQAGEPAAAAKYLPVCLAGDHEEAELIAEVLTPAYLAQYDLNRAQQCGERWVELRPDSARAWWHQGMVQELMPRRLAAVAAYRRAVEADPNHSAARLALCRLLLEVNRPAETSEHVEELLRQGGGDPEAVVVAARCQDALGRRAAARRLLDELLAAHPKHVGALVQRGRLELDSGRAKQAEPFLRRAAEQAPFDPEVLILLVRCLKQVGTPEEMHKLDQRRQSVQRDLAEAQRIAREIVQKPSDPELRRRAGELYLRNGQAQAGLLWLASALRVKPDHPATHRTLAEHFEKVGQPQRAEVHRALASGKQPGSPALPPWLAAPGPGGGTKGQRPGSPLTLPR
jgi:tetratricopeptide (TPR) repeat protein